MTEFNFAAMTPITKGWSDDKKYCITKEDGTKYLLRISAKDRYKNRKALFSMLNEVVKLDIPMCRPVEFGTCSQGVYALHTWVNGEEAEDVIPLLSEREQYALGVKSGEILRSFTQYLHLKIKRIGTLFSIAKPISKSRSTESVRFFSRAIIM